MKSCLLLFITSVVAAAEPVRVRTEVMTFPVSHSALGFSSRDGKPGWYQVRDPVTKKASYNVIEEKIEVVILDNGLIEAWVAPIWGGRLIRAIDKTGPEPVDLFATVSKVENHRSWNAGGVKASFPFFEHGLHLKVPAGWRVVQGSDGSATVAMDLRFTEYRTRADIQRYGRYGDEALAIQVCVRPGSAVVEWRQRKENNNPTGRGDRMWNATLYTVPLVTTPQKVKDAKGLEVIKNVPDTAAMDRLVTFLYPCRWVVDHRPTKVYTSPLWSNLSNWGVSDFAIDAPYGFVGVYYHDQNLNRLKIQDTRPGHGPSAKLYTDPGADFCEHWGGEGWVFEYPGELIAGWRPNGFTHRFWNARGIGQAAFANDQVAVGIEGTAFRLVASRAATATVADDTGVRIASAPIGPGTVVTGTFSGKRLIVSLDGTPVLDQSFPLNRPAPLKDTPVEAAAQAMFERLVAGGKPEHPTFFERQCYGRNESQPGIVDAVSAIKALTTSTNPVRTLSLARVAWRLGMLGDAVRLAKLVPGPEADVVLTLVAWERGQQPERLPAGDDGAFLRALAARQAGDLGKAIVESEVFVKGCPDAWYPRLCLAAWRKDTALAQTLADENPAAPEAQWVLKTLGMPTALDDALRGRAEAQIHLDRFVGMVERGLLTPLPRFPLEDIEK